MLSYLPFAAVPRRLLASTLAAASMTLLTALAPPQAGAVGSYAVQACMDGDIGGIPVADGFGGWIGETSDADSSHTVMNDCAGISGLFMQLKGSLRKAPDDYAGWKFTAPAFTKITDAFLVYDAYTRPSDGHTQGSFAFTAGGVTGGLLAHRGAGQLEDRSAAFHGLSARWLMAAVSCASADGADCPIGEDATAMLRRAVMTLDDAVAPYVTDSSGTAIDDASWRDVEKVLATGTDFGSGVAEFRWYVDGSIVLRHTPDTNGGACVPDSVDAGVPMYHAPKPCPGSVTVAEDLDTTNIADGPHQMELVVADASGRETPILAATKVVANHPPINLAPPAFVDSARAAAPRTGDDLVADRGTWSGPNLTHAIAWERCEADGSACVQVPGATVETYAPTAADLGKRLRMAVIATNPAASVTARTALTATVVAPSPSNPTTGGNTNNGGTTTTNGGSTADAGLPPASGVAPPAADPGHVLEGRVAGEPPMATCPQDRATLVLQGVAGRAIKLGYGRSGRAAVVLTCTATGKAIAHARLDVATRVGTRPAVASQITTDGNGRAELRLARGASRAITVGYRMYADDPLARATATLRVEVRGRVRLRASRRVLRNGQAVRLSGTLAGGRVPRRGVDLAVQWRDGRRWRPFAQVRTDRRGRFHYAYRFTRTRGSVRYALRVQVLKGQVDYPYAPAASKAVRVIVRG